MKRLLFLLLCASSASAQTNIGEVSISQLGDDNDVDAVCTGTVTANAGTGTFIVGDGAGALNTIVDSGTLTCNAGSGTFVVGDGSGALNVVVDSSALPSGAATSALQDGIVKDGAGDTTQANVSTGRLHVDGSGVTQPISAASLPLPTGAATSANQDGIVRDGTGDTTQANVSSGMLHVDGSGVTQPVSGTVAVGAFPDNEPINVAQMNGVAVTMGNGASGTGVQRVTLANDSTGVLATVTTVGTVTNITNLPNEGQQTAANSISVTPDTDNDAIAPDAGAPPTGRLAVGGLTSGATGGLMESLTVCDTPVNINISTATTTLLVTGVSGRHVRICSMDFVTSGAQGIALISGTGATCGTGTTGMGGGTTAATGRNFAANGGIAKGSGSGEIDRTNATGDSVCMVTGANVQVSGRMMVAIF